MKKGTKSHTRLTYGDGAIKRTLRYIGVFLDKINHAHDPKYYYIFVDAKTNRKLYSLRKTKLTMEAYTLFKTGADMVVEFEEWGRAFSFDSEQAKVYLKDNIKIMHIDYTTGEERCLNMTPVAETTKGRKKSKELSENEVADNEVFSSPEEHLHWAMTGEMEPKQENIKE